MELNLQDGCDLQDAVTHGKAACANISFYHYFRKLIENSPIFTE